MKPFTFLPNKLYTFSSQTTVYNTDVEYLYKGEEKELHILDLDMPGRKSVTNAIRNEFLEKLLEHPAKHFEWVEADKYDIYSTFRVFLYGTDAMISEWNATDGFTYVPNSHTSAYLPFIEKMNNSYKKGEL
ncbi:hypothetical protein ACQKJG_18465 [Priestia megaterium]|uniref:hypothetical protein n=1 Tax=Priestia megaterium TaxID=1404 RepID=UPI003D07887C